MGLVKEEVIRWGDGSGERKRIEAVYVLSAGRRLWVR